jgi:hypothetical protein
MRCLLCRNLELAFQAKLAEFTQASSLAYYGVTNQFAAYLHVEMERARADFEDHQLACLSAANEPVHAALEVSNLPEQVLEERDGSISTAA